jgi:hypothetical protein
MKKLIPILLVVGLVLSGLGAVALPEQSEKTQRISEVLCILEPTITDSDAFVSVGLKESESMLLETGKPMLPVVTKTYRFPLGTTIVGVDVNYATATYTLAKKIQPSPQPVILSDEYLAQVDTQTVTMDTAVYSSSGLYPTDMVTVNKGAGLNQGENVLFVNIRITPQYAPAADLLYVPQGDVQIDISYIPPEHPYFMGADTYDLLIITPDTFSSNFQKLVDHKEAMGVKTLMKTTEDIYTEYTTGRDDAEKIKLCIYDMKETYDIQYVLLGGGHKGQTHDWYIPERVTHNNDGWEAGYASDLYYGDIFKIVDNETVFEDWDSNGNGIFAEWSNMIGKGDVMDHYPDVTVGRLTVRYASDVDAVVNKIITYETSADSSWFNNAVVIAGDTFPPSRGGAPGWNEGEMETGETAVDLTAIGFDVTKMWLSQEIWDMADIISTLSEGEGMVHFSGHGNPASWGTFPPNAETESEYINGLQLKEMRKLKNKDELPVVVVGGCHNAQFNVTMANIISGILEYGINGYFFSQPYRFYYMEWVPRDWSSWLVLQKSGGAIGCMGMSGLGYGYVNEGATEGLGGWIEPRFFHEYANFSIDHLGSAHDQAITDYINIIGNTNSDQIDRKTIEEWTLIGDPSLKMGGYD